jgi:hypothetical protein
MIYKDAIKVPYRRTAGWWDSGGPWYQISEWCRENVGISSNDWDYFDGKFLFKNEEDAIAFKLRWGTNK